MPVPETRPLPLTVMVRLAEAPPCGGDGGEGVVAVEVLVVLVLVLVVGGGGAPAKLAATVVSASSITEQLGDVRADEHACPQPEKVAPSPADAVSETCVPAG
jgi:hypothetical protein